MALSYKSSVELTERRSGKVVCKFVNSRKARSGAEIEIGGGWMASSRSSSKESCSGKENYGMGLVRI